jgi:hypothetical protein
MLRCPRCGAVAEPGQNSCPTCQSYQPEVPRQRAPDQAPSGATATPSVLSVDEIKRKIQRRRFYRDFVRDCAHKGSLVGLLVGLIGAVVAAGATLLPYPGPSSFIEVFVLAPPLIMSFGLAGYVVAFAAAVLYISVRPIVAAIFWSVERFDREYGDRRAPGRGGAGEPFA